MSDTTTEHRPMSAAQDGAKSAHTPGPRSACYFMSRISPRTAPLRQQLRDSSGDRLAASLTMIRVLMAPAFFPAAEIMAGAIRAEMRRRAAIAKATTP